MNEDTNNKVVAAAAAALMTSEKNERIEGLTQKAAAVHACLTTNNDNNNKNNAITPGRIHTLRMTMTFVGFTEDESRNRALQQRIRRLLKKITVATPPKPPVTEIQTEASSGSISELSSCGPGKKLKYTCEQTPQGQPCVVAASPLPHAAAATKPCTNAETPIKDNVVNVKCTNPALETLINANGWTVPSTEQDARRALHDLLYEGRWVRRDGVHRVHRALRILQTYPQLAKGHDYWFRWTPRHCNFTEDPWLPPLCHFLYTENANLAMIQNVVKLNPAALQPNETTIHPRRRGLLPLHIACSFQAADEILQFLVDQHPEAKRIPDENGNIAIDLYIKRLRFAEIYDSDYPQILKNCNVLLPPGASYEPAEFDTTNNEWNSSKKQEMSGLVVAMEANAQPIVQYLLSRIPSHYWQYPFTYNAGLQKFFDLQAAKGLDVILPKLKSFKCPGLDPSHGYDEEAIVHLLQALGDNTSIETLELQLPPELACASQEALENFLAKNHTLTSITFSGDPYRQVQPTYLEALERGKARNRSVEEWTFSAFGLFNDVTL